MSEHVASWVGAARARRRLRRVGRWPMVVVGLLIALLVVAVGYPVTWLGVTAFGLPDTFSLRFVIDAVTETNNLLPIRNTLILAVGTAFVSVALGVPLAWATARTDMPGRRLVNALVGIAFITPPYLIALAYIILLGPQAGYLNRMLGELGVGPIDVFSMGGVIAVVSFHGLAYTYFLTYDALRALNAPLEEAARVLGAKPRIVRLRITLPLVAPAIAGGALLAGLQAMADFGPQAFLGTPAQIVFLPTRIYGALGSYPPRFAETAAMSLILVAFTMIGLFAQRAYLERKSYVTVGGQGVRVERQRLGRWRWPALAGCLAVGLFSTIAPFLVLAAAAFSRSWTSAPTLHNLTLVNFETALVGNPVAARGIVNSFLLAAAAATVATAMALVTSYVGLRTRRRGRRVLEYLATLPLGLPGTVLAFGLILAFTRPPAQFLYTTVWILLLAYVARFIPLAVRTTNAAIGQVDPVLEDAARIAGASWAHTTRRVLVPVLWPSLLTAWLLVFIPALTELSATILLYTSGRETISVAIFRLTDLGQFEPVAALSVFTIAVTLVAAGLLRWLGGRAPVHDDSARGR